MSAEIETIPDVESAGVSYPEVSLLRSDASNAEIVSALNEVTSKLSEMTTLLDTIRQSVEPTINALMDSPIAKMMGVK